MSCVEAEAHWGYRWLQPHTSYAYPMRGADTFTQSLFTMRHLDDFVPESHPLRPIRVMVNAAL